MEMYHVASDRNGIHIYTYCQTNLPLVSIVITKRGFSDSTISAVNRTYVNSTLTVTNIPGSWKLKILNSGAPCNTIRAGITTLNLRVKEMKSTFIYSGEQWKRRKEQCWDRGRWTTLYHMPMKDVIPVHAVLLLEPSLFKNGKD